jgi:hypothetical protein
MAPRSITKRRSAASQKTGVLGLRIIAFATYAKLRGGQLSVTDEEVAAMITTWSPHRNAGCHCSKVPWYWMCLPPASPGGEQLHKPRTLRASRRAAETTHGR